jgi:hypothetical protein
MAPADRPTVNLTILSNTLHNLNFVRPAIEWILRGYIIHFFPKRTQKSWPATANARISSSFAPKYPK